MHWSACLLALLCCCGGTAGATSPLLAEPVVAALANELDGDRAKQDVEVLSQQHRMRASEPFHRAAEHIAAQLQRASFTTVEVLKFPADGKTLFGTQKSRPAWDAEFAELWDLERRDEQWVPATRIASLESMPLSLAQDSDSGDVTADLVDVGAGTREQDYAGKPVRGQLVLTSSQPEAVAKLAVDRFGAGGIISYAQNQPTAWSREDETLVRWGHLDSFSPRRTFAFMVSLEQARLFQSRLAAGEVVRLQASVKAQRHTGEYEIVTATIAGVDPALADQQIAFTCHLDHPRPGANDNASGCATILEIARSYARLIERQTLQRTAVLMDRRAGLPVAEQAALDRLHLFYERGVLGSLERWFVVPAATRAARERFLGQVRSLVTPARAPLERSSPGAVYVRNAEPKGPMSVFGYDYLVDHLGAERAAALALPSYSGLRGGGGEYSIEALNFVDGRRNVREIRDALAAEFGPVPLEHVAAYLEALAAIKVIRPR
jgi:hypothetical protein